MKLEIALFEGFLTLNYTTYLRIKFAEIQTWHQVEVHTVSPNLSLAQVHLFLHTVSVRW